MASMPTINKITQNIDGLSDEDLRFLLRLLQAILEAREDHRVKEDQREDENRTTQQAYISDQHPFRGCYELKIINGCGPYRYLRYRDGKILRSKYMGKV
jgi:hypothetical protein